MTLPNRTSSSSCFILHDVLETSTIELLSADEGVDLIQDDSGFIKRFKLSSSGLRCPNSIRRARIEQWASAALSNMTFKPGRLWFHMWQKGWWRESASYARLYVFSWIWGFRNFPMCSDSLYTDWACLLPQNSVSPARTRKVHESHPKENSRRKATDNACDGNRNTSLLLSGFPNYWLLISWRIACNWSYPSSILLLMREMQDAWWSAERKGKRKREELRSHARANRSGRITHDFKNIWCLVDMDEFVHRCHRSGHVVFFSPLCFASCTSAAAKHSSVKFMSTWQVFHMMQLFQQLRPNLSKIQTLCFVFTLSSVYIHYP